MFTSVLGRRCISSSHLSLPIQSIEQPDHSSTHNMTTTFIAWRRRRRAASERVRVRRCRCARRPRNGAALAPRRSADWRDRWRFELRRVRIGSESERATQRPRARASVRRGRNEGKKQVRQTIVGGSRNPVLVLPLVLAFTNAKSRIHTKLNHRTHHRLGVDNVPVLRRQNQIADAVAAQRDACVAVAEWAGARKTIEIE